MEVDTTTIQRVTLLQVGTATHSINLQQRFSELSFTKNGQTLHVNMPNRATDVPPGYYMLFVINGSGVPSKAKIVRINVGSGSGGGGDDVTAPTTPQNLVDFQGERQSEDSRGARRPMPWASPAIRFTAQRVLRSDPRLR